MSHALEPVPQAAFSDGPHPRDAGHGGGVDQQPLYVVAPPNAFSRAMIGLYERVPKWGAPAAIAVCFAGVAGLVLAFDPTHNGATATPTCLIKLSTGLDCPGCGGTRAFYYLLHGNIPEAARHHAMAVFAAPFLVWLYVAWVAKSVFGRTLPVPSISAKTVSVFLAAWAVFMVVRNLPFAPFTRLYV